MYLFDRSWAQPQHAEIQYYLWLCVANEVFYMIYCTNICLFMLNVVQSSIHLLYQHGIHVSIFFNATIYHSRIIIIKIGIETKPTRKEVKIYFFCAQIRSLFEYKIIKVRYNINESTSVLKTFHKYVVLKRW